VKMKVLITSVLVLAVVGIAKSKISPCAAGKGNLPKAITVLDCNNADDCEFIRGKSVLADFEFVARELKN
jgi:hypothetical protein